MTVNLTCPVCGRWLTEVGEFGRAKHCGYEIVVRRLTEKREAPLTTSEAHT